MLNVAPAGPQGGISLIEVLVTIVIVGILFSIGVGSYQSWINNVQIRTTAESIQNGLQLARMESVRRNANVELVLTAATPGPIAVNPALSTTGRNWLVRVQNVPGPNVATDYIQSRSGNEGSKNATVSASAGTGVFTFTGFGRLATTSTAANIDIANPTGGACRTSSTSGMTCLRLTVGAGGQIRMCDPAIPNTNPQGC